MRNPRDFIGRPAGVAYNALVLSGEYPDTAWTCGGENVTAEIERGKYRDKIVEEVEIHRASENDHDDAATALMIALATQ